MKPTLTIVLTLLIAATLSLNAHAQNQIIAMAVETTSNDTTVDGVPDVNPNTLFATEMSVNLDNDDQVTKVHITLGSTQGGSEFLSATFDYNTAGTFGTTTYSQSGNKIMLGLGSFTNMLHYNASVWLEHADNSTTTPITFSR